MNTATQTMLAEMIDLSRQGFDIIPAHFQPMRGISNTVSAAIRCGVKAGKIVQNGVDGLGKPMYAAVLPKITHATTTRAQ